VGIPSKNFLGKGRFSGQSPAAILLVTQLFNPVTWPGSVSVSIRSTAWRLGAPLSIPIPISLANHQLTD
jgi:hypothetical protein